MTPVKSGSSVVDLQLPSMFSQQTYSPSTSNHASALVLNPMGGGEVGASHSDPPSTSSGDTKSPSRKSLKRKRSKSPVRKYKSRRRSRRRSRSTESSSGDSESES